MDHPNNGGYRPPYLAPHFASTPNNPRTSRPRFAYSGPPNYPRPGSSASKPNPDFSVSDIMRSHYVPPVHINDSMINNYGDSYMDSSLHPPDNSFQSEYSSGSFQSQDSIFYSCNESFSNSPRKPFPSHEQGAMPHPNTEFLERPTVPPLSNQPVKLKAKSSMVDDNKRKPFYNKKKRKWRCTLCNIVFSSEVPYNMHKSGSKHAKKLKALEARKMSEKIVVKPKETDLDGIEYRCELCGIVANSANQLQMHWEGVKHKAKVLQLQQKGEVKKPEEKNIEVQRAAEKTNEEKYSKVNGTKDKEESSKKTLEPVFVTPVGVPIKSAFSCTVCDLYLNSDVQLQQHLLGRQHKSKMEGTTPPFHQKKKAALRKKCARGPKDEKPISTEEKTAEPMEVCESKPAEGILKPTEDSQPETDKSIEPKTATVLEPERYEDIEPETMEVRGTKPVKELLKTAKDGQSENVRDIAAKTSKGLEPETIEVAESKSVKGILKNAKDIQLKTAKDIEPKISAEKAKDVEPVKGKDS